MEKITLTEKQKAIITQLGDDTYTPEFVEEWVNRTDNVYINAPAALQAMGAKGFYSAVLAVERAEQGKKTTTAAGNSTAAPTTPPKKRATKKVTEVKANEQDKKPGSNA